MNKKLKIAIPINTNDKYNNYFSTLEHLGAQGVGVDKIVDVDEYDGLLLPGGVDVNPKMYKQENNGCESIDDDLDEIQFAALDKFVKAKKPVIGICRGHQLINVFFGGTLIQDLSNAKEHTQTDDKLDNINELSIDKDSFLYEIYQNEKIMTNSSHHQAVDKIAEGFRVVAKCGDVIEGMQHETLPIITVQFHPERMCFEKTNPNTVDGSLILQYYLNKCK